ncbi:phosphatase PAP2 family protein [Thermodesulfobacteriota bacterium]
MKRTVSILMTGLFGPIFRRTLLALSCSICIVSCTNIKNQSSIESTPERRGSAGYIRVENLPDVSSILPPPPSDGSAAFELDQEMSKKGFALRGTPRWELAAKDQILLFPEPVNAFSCSLEAPITETDTPHLYSLLRKTFDDVEWFDKPLKDQYQRLRPFVVNNEPRCGTARHHNNKSYPSGTAANGWAYALILSEIAPDKTEVLLARGLAYGEADVICNLNWYSDMIAGRVLGAAVVARLHAEPEFLKDLDAAKDELAVIHAKGLTLERDCDAEATALSFSLESAP